ncbi:MAG: Gfo/Idh/MocA family oxidoreductase [Natrialbaceae archaeon]|nr:Gfo/Idh/MocA family oxidoreductase [Natrialbaceae archaeon]
MRNRWRRGGSTADSLAVGVLGVGNIGAVHLQSVRAMPDVAVVAAADAAEDNRAWAESMDVEETYADYTALFEQASIDVAIIALPPFLHRDALEQAAAHGIDVFVEKPLARSVSEAAEMQSIAADANITVGVDHTLRYQQDIVAVKQAFESGRAAHVPYASFVRINDASIGRPPIEEAPSWQLDPAAAGGGALIELGIHCFDVLGWIFGPLEVEGACIERTLDLPVEDSATVRLRAPETGTTIVCHCGTYQWESLPDVNTRLHLEGVASTIDSAEYTPDSFYRSALWSALKNGVRRLIGRQPLVYAPTYYLEAHYAALEAFLEASGREEPAPVGIPAAITALELIEDAYESDQSQEAMVERPELAS